MDGFCLFDEFQYLLVGGIGEEDLEVGEEALEGFLWSSRTLAGLAAMQLFWGGK